MRANAPKWASTDIIAVAAGAGGHTGSLSPFALMQEIREWWRGPLLLAGCIATGRAVLAAETLGADFAYIGSPFLACAEANTAPAFKQMVVEGGAKDIIVTKGFTGARASFLAPSLRANGLDPDAIARKESAGVDISGEASQGKAWRDIWSAGQGIGAVKASLPAGEWIAGLAADYERAKIDDGDASMKNRRVVLASRPSGVAQAENFALREEDARPARGRPVPGAQRLPLCGAGHARLDRRQGQLFRARRDRRDDALARRRRNRRNAQRGSARRRDRDGLVRVADLCDRDACGGRQRRVTESDLPRSLALGVLGINGVTALVGLDLIGEPRPGDTVLVSTAAGAVGSAVGQIAKLRGCRAVGIAGGPEKAAACRDVFGYDAAIDYRAPGLGEAIEAACPEGVNVYFDNTSGAVSDAVYPRLAVGARVVVCGTASISSWDPWPTGPRIERYLLVKRARAQGFVILRLCRPVGSLGRDAGGLGKGGQAAVRGRHTRRAGGMSGRVGGAVSRREPG